MDQHDTLGLGEDVPISTANLNDGLVAYAGGKMILLRVPYPMGFYAKGLDGRIGDAKAGWKGHDHERRSHAVAARRRQGKPADRRAVPVPAGSAGALSWPGIPPPGADSINAR